MRRKKWVICMAWLGFLMLIGVCWMHDWKNDVKDDPLYWISLAITLTPILLPTRWIKR